MAAVRGMSSRGTVIPFYSLRLKKLVTTRAVVKVWCGACRRSGSLDPVASLLARGPEFGVKELEKSLRCDGCGQRGWASVTVDWL